jgi:hypothetical protein
MVISAKIHQGGKEFEKMKRVREKLKARVAELRRRGQPLQDLDK